MKISPNEVKEEADRAAKGAYKHFIKRITMRNLRGFSDESVDFKYPVTALIGTNGGGKSTILGACGIVYKKISPGQFFPKSFIGDDSMADWKVEYELIDKSKSTEKSLVRSVRFKEARWRRDDSPERNVVYIEIQRTVPAGELSRFKRFLKGDSSAVTLGELSSDTIKYATAILDKDISHYRVAQLKNGESTMYVGSTSGKGYSQFHFGAGEASVIATVDRIEEAEDNSLILIEELENGLHPVAVRAMVNYLENVARRRRHQIIFTTHSQDAIDELPPSAVWASINKRVWNGQLSIESLRAFSGKVPDQRVIFVEDDFVKAWCENAMGYHRPKLVPTTRVYSAGGYPSVTKVCEYHNLNPHIKLPAIAVVDGDIYKPGADNVLPGYAVFLGEKIPESTVFDYIYENRNDLAGVLRQRCHLASHPQERIVAAIESVRNSSCDPHIVFDQVGDKLDYASGIKVRDGMIDVFNELNADIWQPVFNAVEEAKSKG